jgi:hypothetical protein
MKKSKHFPKKPSELKFTWRTIGKGLLIYFIFPIVCVISYEFSKHYYYKIYSIDILPNNLIINTNISRRYNVFIRNMSDNVIDGAIIKFMIMNPSVEVEDINIIPSKVERSTINPYIHSGIAFAKKNNDEGVTYRLLVQTLLPNETKTFTLEYCGKATKAEPFIAKVNYGAEKLQVTYQSDK